MDNAAAIDLVRRFLRTMEERDLDAAEALMAPEAKITFPGNKQFESQREMVDASRGRYQWVKKNLEMIDAIQAQGSVIVYVMGTLYGVNRHGVPFADIRFIDRFVIQKGLISQQMVWNDLAESGVLDRTTGAS